MTLSVSRKWEGNMSRRVLPLAVWVVLRGPLLWGLLASAAWAEPLAYVLVQPGSDEEPTELGLLDLATGDLETVGPLGVTLVDAYLTLSPDGTLYAVDFFRLGVPEPRVEIHRLDRETGAATPIAQREFGEPVLFLRGLTADARDNLWLLVHQGPSSTRYLMFRFEIASRELIREGSMIGSFRGLTHRGGLLWTIFSPPVPPGVAFPETPPGGRSLSTMDPSTLVAVPRAPIERVVEPGLSFDSLGELWGLTARFGTHRRESFRIDIRSGQLEGPVVLEDPPDAIFPGSLAVLPLTAIPAVPTLGGGAMVLLAVVLLGIGVLRIRGGLT